MLKQLFLLFILARARKRERARQGFVETFVQAKDPKVLDTEGVPLGEWV